MERLADQLIGDVRAIEVAGVDVIDPARHRLAQDGEGGAAILGRTEDAGPGELHRTIAHAFHSSIAERECRGGVGHGEPPKLDKQHIDTGYPNDNPAQSERAVRKYAQ